MPGTQPFSLSDAIVAHEDSPPSIVSGERFAPRAIVGFTIGQASTILLKTDRNSAKKLSAFVLSCSAIEFVIEYACSVCSQP